MEKFSVKRGLVKQIGGNAGLAKLATQYFDDVNANSDGEFTASYGILTKVTGNFDKDGKLVVDVEQLKGDELNDFLAAEGGRQQSWRGAGGGRRGRTLSPLLKAGRPTERDSASWTSSYLSLIHI